MQPRYPEPKSVLLRVEHDDGSLLEFTVHNPHKIRLDVSGHPPETLFAPLTTDAFIPADFSPHVEIELDAHSLNQTEQICMSRVSAGRARLLAEGEAAVRADERERCADQLREVAGRMRAIGLVSDSQTVLGMATMLNPPAPLTPSDFI